MDSNVEPIGDANAASNLYKLIKQLLLEKAYDGVKMLFNSPTEAAKNLQHMPVIAMDMFVEICQPSLKDEINLEIPELFDCADELLKLVAKYAPLEPITLEIMEMVEESRSLQVFSACMRALQVVLLRVGDEKPKALEWSLHSVINRLQALPLPEYLSEGYDESQARLLEQDKDIETFLGHYITVGIFHKPLLININERSSTQTFRDCGMTKRNIFTCFLVQMLGKPLALLELSYVKGDLTLTNVQQVVETLTMDATLCIGDPFYLLSLVETRARWQRKLDASKGVHEMSSENIFMIEEKLPLYALGMYYHSLFVGNLLPKNAPKVYKPLYLFESCTYLAAVLMEHHEPPLQYCGLRLIEYLLSALSVTIPESSLQLDVHKRFCEALCKIVGYSPQVGLRQLGLHVLRSYVLSFDDNGKYFILKNLLETLQHDGLMGYLSGMYKDLVNKALVHPGALPAVYHGVQFRTMLLRCVCVLPKDVKSDLLLNADRLCNALNILRYFALRDSTNRTGFWDIVPEIKQRLLQPLSKALDFSLAHYKAYKERVQNGQSASDDALMQNQLNMLAVNIANSGVAGDGDSEMPNIGEKEKLEVMSTSITSLEALLSLYYRANECLELGAKQRQQSVGPLEH